MDSLYKNALNGNVTAQICYLKNRRPSEWRDVQQIDQAIGHYIISDRPMSEEEWIEQRTKQTLIEHEQTNTEQTNNSDDDSEFGTRR